MQFANCITKKNHPSGVKAFDLFCDLIAVGKVCMERL